MKTSFEQKLQVATYFLSTEFPKVRAKVSSKKFSRAIVVSSFYINDVKRTLPYKTDQDIQIIYKTLYDITSKCLGFDGDVLDVAIFTHLGLI
jgi:hypothetical protein